MRHRVGEECISERARKKRDNPLFDNSYCSTNSWVEINIIMFLFFLGYHCNRKGCYHISPIISYLISFVIIWC